MGLEKIQIWTEDQTTQEKLIVEFQIILESIFLKILGRTLLWTKKAF